MAGAIFQPVPGTSGDEEEKALEFESYLWVPTKAGYVKGDEKPKVDCILCSIRDQDPRVRSLEVWRDESNIAVLNLYPYNPGHVMIFPVRHVTRLSEMDGDEFEALFDSIKLSIRAIERAYSPDGFNVGFNIGEGSGASIEHLHAHVVPRYKSELGFIDIIGGGKIMVEDPEIYLDRVRGAFRETLIE
jgi:ATP adenylyltransferase